MQQRALEEARKQVGERSSHTCLQDVLVELSHVHVFSGRFKEAHDCLEEAIELGQQHRVSPALLASRVEECKAMKQIAESTQNWVSELVWLLQCW